MTCSSRIAAEPLANEVQRARPLLGTTVAIRVSGLAAAEANAAIDRGFAALAEIHGLMSFHDPASELSRLNSEAWRCPVAIGRHTAAVLRQALEIAAESNGAFDPTVAGELVAAGALPRPPGAMQPDPAASWLDVAVSPDGRVTFYRPLWLDFGGIAKGYAVDHALAAMELPSSVQVTVDAGGDLRVAGPEAEAVQLGLSLPDAVPVVAIQDGALASSTSAAQWGAEAQTHFDGHSRGPIAGASFAAVAAPSCMIADALTKPVLALEAGAEPLLRQFGAAAYLYDERAGWRILGET